MPASRRINILFIHANNTDIGGSDYCMLRLVTTLDRKRYNPMVLIGLETGIVEKYRQHGISPIIMPMFRIRWTKDIIYQLRFILAFFPTVLRIARFIRQYRIDIVHSNDFQDFYGAIAARLTGIKAIQHDRLIMWRKDILRRILTSFILAVNHKIIAVSEAVAKEMFNVNEGNHPKVVVCYDWLDMERVGHAGKVGTFRKEMRITENMVFIGVVGRLEPWKGQHVFVRAAAEVAKTHSNSRFVIVGGEVLGGGRERYRSELEALAKALRMNDKIIFTGYRTDIMNIMDSLDVYVHSSIEAEPFGLVVLEAMTMGKPTIVPRQGGVLEQVVDGVTALTYDPGDYVGLAKSICRLVEDPDLAVRLGKAGKERANRLFNREVLYRRFESLYESLIGPGL